MIQLFRRLCGAWIGFELVALGVGYVLYQLLPPADSYGPILLGAILGGALVGVPSGILLTRLLRPWPEHLPHWRGVAACTILGSLLIIMFLQVTNPKLATLVAVPILLLPVEFAAFIVRRRPQV